MNEVKPIKVAVVGLGRAGWDIHVRRMRGHAEFQITAVADFEESRRNEARSEFGCDAFTEYKSLLKNANAELVVVASQSSTHAEISCAALRSNRHVLVEKPMATNVKDARPLLRTFITAIGSSAEPSSHGLDGGRLALLETVHALPSRRKCAALPWLALEAALEGRPQAVSTGD